MNDDPLQIFANWLSQAKQTEAEAEKMALATVGPDGMPSVRMVLLKQVDARGLVFYTNLNSHKAKQLAENPQAALCFYWPSQGRQVRVQGNVTLVSTQEADAYFQTRPRGSQIGAWISAQSAPLEDHELLQQRASAFTAEFADQTLARPEFWSGFRIKPVLIEFWQAGKDRLHQRTVYRSQHDAWHKGLLYP
jgi:pyridoxamine 5'-phosphate oxidase